MSKITRESSARTKSGKRVPRRVRVVRLSHPGGFVTAHAGCNPLEIEAPAVRHRRSARITQDAA